MELTIGQAATIIDTRVFAFQKPVTTAQNASRLYYHFIFKANKNLDSIETAERRRFFGFVLGCAQSLHGEIESIGGTGNGVHILVSLNSTQTPADFIKKIKLFSSAWARRKLDLHDFAWLDVEASTVSNSQRWQVTSYIQSRGFLF